MAAAAREVDAASKRKAEENCSAEAHETVARAAADVDETVDRAAAAADVDECSDDEADPVIRNLNLMGRRNLMTPEWIENRKKLHYERHALLNRVYDALENGEIESDSDDDDDGAAAAERSKRLWAGVDLSGLNTVESRGMDAIAVYPVGLNPEEEEKDQDEAAAAAESSS